MEHLVATLFREIVDSNFNQSVTRLTLKNKAFSRGGNDNEPEKQAHQRDWTRRREIIGTKKR